VRLHPRAEKVDRLRLEPRLLAQLAAEAVERVLALFEEAAREVPEPGRRIVRAPAEQHAPVFLDQRLRARHRVRPRLEAARDAGEVPVRSGQRPGAAGAEAPAVERTHDRRGYV